jgi:hypothetical protein
MKSQFMQIVLTAGLTVFGSLTVSAQDRSESAKIPFAFHAYQNSFAAGDYVVNKINDSGTFQLISMSNGRSILLNAPLSIEAKDYSEGKLTFACYQGDCVLKQIWLSGSNLGYRRSDSAVDKDLQRKLGMATMINVRLAAH